MYLLPPLYLRPWIESCVEELQGLLRYLRMGYQLLKGLCLCDEAHPYYRTTYGDMWPCSVHTFLIMGGGGPFAGPCSWLPPPCMVLATTFTTWWSSCCTGTATQYLLAVTLVPYHPVRCTPHPARWSRDTPCIASTGRYTARSSYRGTGLQSRALPVWLVGLADEVLWFN